MFDGTRGRRECKFQYELITLSQPASKARGLQNFPEDKPRKCVDLVSYTGRSGGRGWGPQAAPEEGMACDSCHPQDADDGRQLHIRNGSCRGGGRGQ